MTHDVVAVPGLRQQLANKQEQRLGGSKLNSFANDPHELSNRNVRRDKKLSFVNAGN